jgi:hypothetical protein
MTVFDWPFSNTPVSHLAAFNSVAVWGISPTLVKVTLVPALTRVRPRPIPILLVVVADLYYVGALRDRSGRASDVRGRPSTELPEPRNFRSGPKSAAWVANEIPNEHCQSSASGYLDPDKLTVPLRELITLDRTGSTEFAVILIFCNTVRSKRVRTNCLR